MNNRRQKRQERHRQKRAMKSVMTPPFEKANYLFQSGKADQAAKILKSFLDGNPEHFDSLVLHGVIFATSGNLDAAIPLFERAAQIRPGDTSIHINLAKANEELGRFDAAIGHYRRSLEIDPNNDAYLINLGNLLNKNKDFTGAADSYKRALEVNPENPGVHSNLGNTFVAQDRLDDAVHSYRRALEIDPGIASIHCNLGDALEAHGLLDDAVASHKRAIEIDPEYVSAHCSLGIAYYKLGLLDDAESVFHKALAISPDYDIAWDHFMFVVKALQFSKARSNAETDTGPIGLACIPQDNVNFAMVEYYLKKFRPHEAGENFQKAMAALPAKTDEEVPIDGMARQPVSNIKLPDNMVALLHSGRSGTGLLHSLIDGHPEISTLPSIYLRGFFNYGVWKKLAAEGWNKLPERFADEFAVLFDATSSKSTPARPGENSVFLGEQEGMTGVGEGRNESLSLDRDRFCFEALRLMEGFESVDQGTFIRIIHAAFEATLGTTTNKHTIFYHIHNPDDFAKLNFLRYTPNARLIMMVREPIQNCESWMRSNIKNNDYSRIVHKIIALLLDTDQVEFRRHDSVGVRLEDLKTRLEATMQSLCAWLGVEDFPGLYEMTAQGKKWWGEPASPYYIDGKGMSLLEDGPIKRAVGKVFSEKDQFLLRTLFYPFSVRFGYRKPDPGQFEKDLNNIRPMLDDILDFEKTMADRSNIEYAQFKNSGPFLLLRACFHDRWETLNKFGDYPHMLTPLDID